MYQILTELASFLKIFGGTLLVLGLIALPFEFSFKKKRGPMPVGRRVVLYASLGFASLLIAVPLKLFVFKPRRPAAPRIDFAKLQSEQEARKEKSVREAIDGMNKQFDKELGIRRVELTPEEAGRRRRQEAEQDAEIARQRQEARERQEAMRREMEKRAAEQTAKFRRAEEMNAMRRADDFHPPEGSTTPEQKALDGKIVALNEELQRLKAEKERFDKEMSAASAAMREVTKERPIDHVRVREEQTRLIEAQRAAIETSRAITEKRREVIDVLEKRYSPGG